MPTDPAVEALAASGFGPQDPADRDWPLDIARAALDHIAAHLHDDTPEGEALRARLGLKVQRTERVHRMSQAAMDADEVIAWGCRNCHEWTDIHGRHANPECPDDPQEVRLVSQWRPADE